jgi:hypothetical protein
MKKDIIKTIFVMLFSLIVVNAVSASEGGPATDDNMGVKQGSNTGLNEGLLKSALTGINITGGISAGYFYASNPGEDTSDDEFLLSNLLVEISSSNEDLPVGFIAAFGETSTPTILDAPENNTDFKIEYASLTLKPVTDLSLEIGLLQPNAGFENTYTFNNKNVILGAVASQQPYNAYGARIGYDVQGLSLWGGYYTERLDDEEYNSPDYAWEIGLSGSIWGNSFTLYHYNIKGQRNMSGAVIERTIRNIDFAFNIDYWSWDSRMKKLYGSTSSIGGALYICPNFGNLSIPLRLEYINQNNSQIIIESPTTKHIYTATVSPTWRFIENTYIRAESAYVNADGAFADEEGRVMDNRIDLALELGFLF